MDFETPNMIVSTATTAEGTIITEKGFGDICQNNNTAAGSSSGTVSPSVTSPLNPTAPLQHETFTETVSVTEATSPATTIANESDSTVGALHKGLNDKNQKPVMSADERKATKKSLCILAVIFITSLSAMFYIYAKFPELNESEKQHMKIPRDIQDAKMLAKVLDRYKDMYYFEVMFGVIISYVFLQTFAIPGSLFLSILLGFLYKFPIALFLICFCSSLGATLCYTLSNLVGRRLICHFWPKKTSEWCKTVDKHRDSLLNYMLFLRMTPLLPNWFINLASPVIGVPLSTFAIGTFCGVAPPSILAIQAGKTLQKLSSSSDAFSWTSMGILSVCALAALMPGLMKNKLKQKLE